MIEGTKNEQDMAYLASNLLTLKAQSITSAAKACGLNPSNVAGWLKGRPSTLSGENQNIFLGYLGISGGTLASDRVHIWTISHKLEPLREILAWSEGEFEAVVLIDDSVPTQNFICLFGPLKSIRILVRQTISPMVPASDLPIPCVIRRHPAIRIGHDLFDRIKARKKIPLHGFDRALKSEFGSRNAGEMITVELGKSLTSKELKEILVRAEDWSVDSGVLREDIRTLLEHIESREEK